MCHISQCSLSLVPQTLNFIAHPEAVFIIHLRVPSPTSTDSVVLSNQLIVYCVRGLRHKRKNCVCSDGVVGGL